MVRFKWFGKNKKLSVTTEYDTRYLLDVLNYEPVDHGFSRKFIEDGISCVEKEYKAIKDLNVDDKNTDVATGRHKTDSSREIAYLNQCFIDSLFSLKNLLCKAVGDMVLLDGKLDKYERDARKLEKELEEEENELQRWRGGQNEKKQ